ncbi:MAG TPA: Clp protease N-terminal domain-containing protein [Acidimicrobiales bacterium]|nr:Clp protease N-terminal domain-containing protein [Acidimicrobiales bacterium]
MFDRCDADTMIVIDTAIAEARALGHNYVGTEHLLVALVQHRDLLPNQVGRMLPTEVQAVRAALEAEFDGPPRDEELLASLGIDLEGVRAAVRRTFGPDALERLARRPVRQPWQPWRRPRRRCMSILARGTLLALTPRVKRVMERALSGATRRGLPAIDPCALLLGMVEEERALSNRLLQDLGVPPDELRAAILRAAS